MNLYKKKKKQSGGLFMRQIMFLYFFSNQNMRLGSFDTSRLPESKSSKAEKLRMKFSFETQKFSSRFCQFLITMT